MLIFLKGMRANLTSVLGATRYKPNSHAGVSSVFEAAMSAEQTRGGAEVGLDPPSRKRIQNDPGAGSTTSPLHRSYDPNLRSADPVLKYDKYKTLKYSEF